MIKTNRVLLFLILIVGYIGFGILHDFSLLWAHDTNTTFHGTFISIVYEDPNNCNSELSVKYGRDYNQCCIPYNATMVNNINQFLSEHHTQTIQKIIHQVWIGPKETPYKWINSFKNDFMSQFSGWKHYLWTDENISTLNLTNQIPYNIEPTYNGKSDILRYELLYKYGGIYIDADSSWLGHLDLEDLIKQTNDNAFFVAQECNESLYECQTYGVAGGVMGSSKSNPITKYLIESLSINYFKCNSRAAAFRTIGPYFLDQVLNGFNITVFPYYYFYPIYWHSNLVYSTPLSEIVKMYPKSYMTQYGFTTIKKD